MEKKMGCSLKLLIATIGLTMLAGNGHAVAPQAEATADPVIMAEAVETQGNSSSISISIVDGAPKFFGWRRVSCNPDGQCGESTGMSRDGISGDIDLSGFPPGDVAVSISIGDDAYAAGWRFPGDPYQGVAIIVYTEGGVRPDPVFGNWPPNGEFGTPSLSADLKTVSFIDSDNDGLSYEYAVAVNGPGGRVVLDPKIINKNLDR